MDIKLIKRIKFMIKRWKHNDEMYYRTIRGYPSRRERIRRALYLTALNIELTWQEEMCAMNCDRPPPEPRQSMKPILRNAMQGARDFCRRLDEKIEKHCRIHGLKFEPLFPDVYSPSPVPPPPPPPPPPPSPEENLRTMVKTLGEIRDILASRELD